VTRWILLVAYGLNVGLMSGTAWAQQPNRVPVVGLLMSSVALHDPVLDALRAGLREQGYFEGQNIRLEYRGAQGNLDLLPSLAEELVRLKVDAIVVGNERTARVAKEASASIPIVVSLYNYDPVAGGLIDSFARPGGNLTGIFTRTSELVGKRLEQLKEMIPNLSRLAVFWDPLGQGELSELQLAARSIGVQLQLMELRPPYDFDAAFKLAFEQVAKFKLVVNLNTAKTLGLTTPQSILLRADEIVQ
jgi:putative tryptophan/tyrosine transport system substrate-binding protein